MATPVTFDTNGNPLFKCQFCGLLVQADAQTPGDDSVSPGETDVPSDTTDTPLFDVCPAFSNGSPHVPF